MNTEPITNRCPKCQAPLPANAPRGLCPKCLLAAVSTPTEAGQPTDRDPPPSLQMVAAAFPQLEILELIGQGGMGVVYKARQPRLDRLVALKLLPRSLAADATFAERFNREARVLARLNHPNIVTVHDFGQSAGFFYLLMEFVDGVNLRQAMQAGRFTPQQAMMLVPKICEALQFAHDEGILHRDIKPENILLDTRERLKIADFGIAKLVGEARENITLTASGQAVGTPHYMAPEQLEHPQDVDQRADIYSLGVVFYEMLTGELPIGRFAPPSAKATVDPRVDDVVFHALEKEREKRFRSATEVKTSVEAITAHPALVPGPAVAVPTPSASGSSGASPVRRAPCYFNTPARMRDCLPSAAPRIFTCRGELALDGECLTFTSTWRASITIPLKDIGDLSVGQFQMWTTPWVMKYARVSFLSVTYRGGGQMQTVHLTPVERQATTAGEINDCVGRWFEWVRHAASQCAGKTPHTSETASMSVSAEPAWNRKVLPLVLGCLLMGIVTWALQAWMVQGPIWLVCFFILGLLIVGLGWFSVSFLRANSALGRGHFDAVTSDDPPVPEPAGASAGGGVHHRQAARWARTSFLTIAIFALAVVLLLTWLSYRNRYVPPTGERTTGAFASATAAFKPESETQFVLYSMLVTGKKSPDSLGWHFKCLLPARHLVRVLFVRWTDGVPEVENSLSGCFQVADAPIDANFALGGQRLTETASTQNTNGIQWAVNLFGRAGHERVFPKEPAYQEVETPARMTIQSGHQGILRLADHVRSPGRSALDHSGIELRIFLEPLKYLPVRTDPFQIEGKGYVAGDGSGWTKEQALKAIKEWPVDK